MCSDYTMLEEIWILIFKQCVYEVPYRAIPHYETVYSLMGVNKKWRDIITKTSYFWRIFKFDSYIHTRLDQFHIFLMRSGIRDDLIVEVDYLPLSGLGTTTIDLMTRLTGRIQYLRIGDLVTPYTKISLLRLVNHSSLRSLVYSGSNPEGVIGKDLIELPNLRLIITSGNGNLFHLNLDNLQELRMRNFSWDKGLDIWSRCKNLRVLILDKMAVIGTSIHHKIVLQNLIKLDLDFGHEYHDNLMENLDTPNIRHLYLRNIVRNSIKTPPGVLDYIYISSSIFDDNKFVNDMYDKLRRGKFLKIVLECSNFENKICFCKRVYLKSIYKRLKKGGICDTISTIPCKDRKLRTRCGDRDYIFRIYTPEMDSLIS